MTNKDKPEKRTDMAEAEREERMRRMHEFWWGKRPSANEEKEEKK